MTYPSFKKGSKRAHVRGAHPSRNPRSSIDGVPQLASSDTHSHHESAQHISFAEFTAMQQTLAEMKSMMDRVASGPNPVGELLVADPSNHCPRPSAFQSLSSVDKGWVPLLPMEAVPLYQTVQARADGAKGLDSVLMNCLFCTLCCCTATMSHTT